MRFLALILQWVRICFTQDFSRSQVPVLWEPTEQDQPSSAESLEQSLGRFSEGPNWGIQFTEQSPPWIWDPVTCAEARFREGTKRKQVSLSHTDVLRGTRRVLGRPGENVSRAHTNTRPTVREKHLSPTNL